MLTLVNHIISGSQNPSHFLTMFFHYKEPGNTDEMKAKQDHHNNMWYKRLGKLACRQLHNKM